MDAVKSVMSSSASYSAPSSSCTSAYSWQYQLAYEMEKLSELRRQVAAQEERFNSMQQHSEQLGCGSDTAVEDTQSSAIESLVKVKERELALALMRVAELTRQLEQLRQGQLDGVLVDSTSAHAKLLDRNPELLQGIVRPLKSAHHSSAIQRSRSAADVALQASNQELSTGGSTEQVSNQFSSLPSALSKMRSCPTDDSAECSISSADAQTQKKEALLNRKMEVDTNARTLSGTAAKVRVDLNENVITSGQAPRAVPSHGKSVEISEKTTSLTMKPSNAIMPSQSSSSTVDETVSSDLAPTKSSFSQANGSDLGDGNTDSTSSHTGTRSWVSSSSYRQKLGSRAASRYQNITSRLYGDDWLGNLSNRVGKRSTSNAAEPATDTVPLSANSSEESQPNESLISIADSPASSLSGSNHVPTDVDSKPSSSSSHLVYSCSTSDRTTVDRPSLTSESGDNDDADSDNDGDSDDDEDKSDDDDDGDDDAEATAEVTRFGLHPERTDLMRKKDVVRWRQRFVASPPPRRAAHALRRFEDPSKDLSVAGAGSGMMPGRSVQSHTASFSDSAPSESPKSPESSKHVSFDLFTLSLNAALEGELDVLQSLFSKVDDMNQSNEDGLTVLHNGVCSGCQDVLAFLVHAGCDVNVADCDGWTPLHCAASSNNIEAVQLLIEHGAGVLAFTWDAERETPLDKCCPGNPGYEECYQIIAEAVKLFGVANNGRVYAVANYEAGSVDEMSFSAGDQLTVLHKGDEKETAWWWARHPDGKEGYVPQNLLALYPPTGCKSLPTKSLIETSC